MLGSIILNIFKLILPHFEIKISRVSNLYILENVHLQNLESILAYEVESSHIFQSYTSIINLNNKFHSQFEYINKNNNIIRILHNNNNEIYDY